MIRSMLQVSPLARLTGHISVPLYRNGYALILSSLHHIGLGADLLGHGSALLQSRCRWPEFGNFVRHALSLGGRPV